MGVHDDGVWVCMTMVCGCVGEAGKFEVDERERRVCVISAALILHEIQVSVP